jgi:hypothetical protein
MRDLATLLRCLEIRARGKAAKGEERKNESYTLPSKTTFKAQVALEALKGSKTIQQITKEYEVHPVNFPIQAQQPLLYSLIFINSGRRISILITSHLSKPLTHRAIWFDGWEAFLAVAFFAVDNDGGVFRQGAEDVRFDFVLFVFGIATSGFCRSQCRR